MFNFLSGLMPRNQTTQSVDIDQRLQEAGRQVVLRRLAEHAAAAQRHEVSLREEILMEAAIAKYNRR